MAKIITPGKIPPKLNKLYTCVCGKCGCVAEYEEKEVRRFPIPPFPLHYKMLKRSFVKCEFCTEPISFDEKDVEIIEKEEISLLSRIRRMFQQDSPP
jgi:hypothetical protein